MASDTEDARRERDVARSRISRAIAALESGRPQDALTALKGEGLCEYNRCASLTAAHRLLERWIYRMRGGSPRDALIEYDTESFLGRMEFPLRCPACEAPLRLCCPLSGCLAMPPSSLRILKHTSTYVAKLAPHPFSCQDCESPLCVSCPACGREPLDKHIEALKREEKE